MQQSEKLAQQLQAQVGAAQSHGEGLQSICDILSKKNKDLTAELSGSKASVEDLQVGFFISAGNAATLQATTGCTSESVIIGIPWLSSHHCSICGFVHQACKCLLLRACFGENWSLSDQSRDLWSELCVNSTHMFRLTDGFALVIAYMQASLQQHKSHSEQQLAARNRDLESLRSDLQQRKVAGKQLQDTADALAAEKEELKLQLSEVSAKAREVTTDLNIAKTNLEQSATVHAKLSDRFKDSQQQLAASRADVDATQQELAAQTASVTKLQGELSTANTQLAQSATAHTKLSQQLQASQQQLAANQNDADATRQELAAQTASVTRLQTQFEDSALALHNMQAQVDAANAVEQQLQQQLQATDEARLQLQKQLEQRCEAHQLLQKQLRNQHEAHQQLQQQHQEKTEAQQQLQKQLISVRFSQVTLQAQVQQHEAQVARLQGDKDAQSEQIVTLKEQQGQQQAAFQQLHTQLVAKDSALAAETKHHAQVQFFKLFFCNTQGHQV